MCSISTVHSHRERIREKLGIKNEKVNLSVFLTGDLDLPEETADPSHSLKA